MAKVISLKPTKPVSNGALKSDELPSRIKILNWGENETLDGKILLDDQSLKSFYANQREIGRTQAPLDFNHNTVPGTEAYKSDKEPRAIAAYGVPTIIPGDGLYYEYMQWTPSGEKAAKDYADLSPAVITDESNHVIGLHSCALTPAGAVANLSFYSAESLTNLMDVSKLKANEAKMHKEPDDDEDEDEEDDDGKDGVKAECAKAMSAEEKSKKPYGDVTYADPGYKADKKKRYPIDTEEHVRAALSYINMPKNHKGYTPEQVAKIKGKIQRKAKSLGIELRAEAAAEKVQVNAYVPEAHINKAIDNMVNEDTEYVRQKLGLPEGTEPTDVMRAIRAKWEGLEKDKDLTPLQVEADTDADEEEKPTTDPTVRNGKVEEGNKVTFTYSADDISKLIDEKIKTFSAKLDAMEAEKNARLVEIENQHRQSLIEEASRDGKVIPLSQEALKTIGVKVLEEMVGRLTPSVNMERRALRPLNAEGKAVGVSKARSAQAATEMFNGLGIKRGEGYVGFMPGKDGKIQTFTADGKLVN